MLKLRAPIAIIAFALLSVVLLVIILATSGSNPSFEAANPTGQASVVEDSLASEGNFIEFGEVATPPPLGDFPTAETTGIRGVGLSESDLTPWTNGEFTEPNRTYENLVINTCVRIKADNVTIRRSLVRNNCSYVVSALHGASNFVMEDSTLIGTGEAVAGVISGTFTCQRCDISGGQDGSQMFSNAKMLDSYIHDTRKFGSTHNDGIQISGTGGVDNVLIKGNRILGHFQTSTSAIIVQTERGPVNGVIVEDNYLFGGSYSLYIRMNPNVTMYGQPTNSIARNNTFVKGSSGVYNECIKSGKTPDQCNFRGSFMNISGNNQAYGNVFEDGTPL